MSAANFSDYQYPSYSENLAQAFRSFLAALLAVKPIQRQTAGQPPARSARERVRTIKALYRMAGDCETLSPNLAKELRFLAGRD